MNPKLKMEKYIFFFSWSYHKSSILDTSHMLHHVKTEEFDCKGAVQKPFQVGWCSLEWF